SRPARRPLHRAPARCRPALEVLEDRVVPAPMVDVGGLRFMATGGFEQTGQEDKATSGDVGIGYTPSGTEDFVALLRADLTDANSEFLVDNNAADPTFSVQTAPVKVVVGGHSLPIWQQSDSQLKVDIPQLIGTNGFSVPSTITPVPFQVAKVDFTL